MAPQRRRGGTLRRVVLWVSFAGVLACGVAAFVLVREITSDLPPVDQLLEYRPPVATRIYADDGSLIGEFFTERRYLVELERVPRHVRLAFLAAEDAEFYRHRGVDPASVLRALWANVTSQRVVQGGSTITQQVVKALLLSPERSLERKAKEAILAYRLESKLGKDEILWLYLNQIYFGAGAYGIAAAAREFFDADVEQLTIAQAALLAGLPQRPSDYDPQRRLPKALARQRYVLGRMLEEGFITQAQYEAALAEEIRISPRRPAAAMAAPWYVEHVRRLLEERYGGSAPYQLGLQVYTAVDRELDRAAEEALRAGLRQIDREQGFRGPLQRIDLRNHRKIAVIEPRASATGRRRARWSSRRSRRGSSCVRRRRAAWCPPSAWCGAAGAWRPPRSAPGTSSRSRSSSRGRTTTRASRSTRTRRSRARSSRSTRTRAR